MLTAWGGILPVSEERRQTVPSDSSKSESFTGTLRKYSATRYFLFFPSDSTQFCLSSPRLSASHDDGSASGHSDVNSLSGTMSQTSAQLASDPSGSVLLQSRYTENGFGMRLIVISCDHWSSELQSVQMRK